MLSLKEKTCAALTYFYSKLELLAVFLSKLGLSANIMTFLGLCFAVLGLNFVSLNQYVPALLCLILNRFCDITDGLMARLKKISRFGIVADICADFISAALFIWGFILAKPQHQALEGSFLLLSFFISAIALMAYTMISKQDFYVLNSSNLKICAFGNIQNLDIFSALFLMCLLPNYFMPIAVFFGLLALLKALLILNRAYYDLEVLKK